MRALYWVVGFVRTLELEFCESCTDKVPAYTLLMILSAFCMAMEGSAAMMFINWLKRDNDNNRRVLQLCFIINVVTTMANSVIFMVFGIGLDRFEYLDKNTAPLY